MWGYVKVLICIFIFITLLTDGYTILGSSDLSGRYRTGSVWYFNNALTVPSKFLCETAIECETTVCDGKFLGNNKTVCIDESLILLVLDIYNH